MSYFLVILLSITITSGAFEKLPDAIHGTIADVTKKCISENNLSTEMLPHQEIQFIDIMKNEGLQKVYMCGMIASGFGDETGHVKVEKTAQFFPQHVQKVIEECNKVDGKDPIATATKFLACIEEKSPVLYSLTL